MRTIKQTIDMKPTQQKLLDFISNYMGKNNPIKYDIIKSLCIEQGFKSFDSSFNSLFTKGFVLRHETNDFSNQFKLA
jgi:hypothetical protein